MANRRRKLLDENNVSRSRLTTTGLSSQLAPAFTNDSRCPQSQSTGRPNLVRCQFRPRYVPILRASATRRLQSGGMRQMRDMLFRIPLPSRLVE